MLVLLSHSFMKIIGQISFESYECGLPLLLYNNDKILCSITSDFAHSLKLLCLYLLDHMLKQDKGLKMTIAYRFLSQWRELSIAKKILGTWAKRNMVLVGFNFWANDDSRSQGNCLEIKGKELRLRNKLNLSRVGWM